MVAQILGSLFVWETQEEILGFRPSPSHLWPEWARRQERKIQLKIRKLNSVQLNYTKGGSPSWYRMLLWVVMEQWSVTSVPTGSWQLQCLPHAVHQVRSENGQSPQGPNYCVPPIGNPELGASLAAPWSITLAAGIKPTYCLPGCPVRSTQLQASKRDFFL